MPELELDELELLLLEDELEDELLDDEELLDEEALLDDEPPPQPINAEKLVNKLAANTKRAA